MTKLIILGSFALLLVSGSAFAADLKLKKNDGLPRRDRAPDFFEPEQVGRKATVFERLSPYAFAGVEYQGAGLKAGGLKLDTSGLNATVGVGVHDRPTDLKGELFGSYRFVGFGNKEHVSGPYDYYDCNCTGGAVAGTFSKVTNVQIDKFSIGARGFTPNFHGFRLYGEGMWTHHSIASNGWTSIQPNGYQGSNGLNSLNGPMWKGKASLNSFDAGLGVSYDFTDHVRGRVGYRSNVSGSENVDFTGRGGLDKIAQTGGFVGGIEGVINTDTVFGVFDPSGH